MEDQSVCPSGKGVTTPQIEITRLAKNKVLLLLDSCIFTMKLSNFQTQATISYFNINMKITIPMGKILLEGFQCVNSGEFSSPYKAKCYPMSLDIRGTHNNVLTCL